MNDFDDNIHPREKLNTTVSTTGTTRNPLRVARGGMVASGNPLVSTLGLGILRAGGNAVDAAVSMALALAVVEPNRSQLGGDVVIQYWDAATRQVFTLAGIGAAPSGATVDAVATASDRSPLGIRAATVPGAVDGWLTALRKWGTYSAAAAVAPAVSLAEQGVALSTAQELIWRRHADVIGSHPHMSATFGLDPLRVGAVLKQPRLADTLRHIGEGGRSGFYAGSFAEKLLKYSDRKGGYFTADDLLQHRSTIDDPLLTSYRGYSVTTNPMPTCGVLTLAMLNIVEQHELARVRPESADAIHLLAEIKKLAFADRDAYLGDNGASPVKELLSKSYADRQRRRVSQKAAGTHCGAGKLPKVEGQEAVAPYIPASDQKDMPIQSYGHGTQESVDSACLCVVDEAGNAVVITQSLGGPFGCGVVVPDTGVILNNRLSAFSLDPLSPNALVPGKRPLSPFHSYMVFKGDDLWAVGGAGGGETQVESNVQVLTHMIDHDRNPQDAIEAPRWHAVDEGANLGFEERLPLDTCYELRTLGHHFAIDGPWSADCACQCIVVDEETKARLGASDPRVDGLAVGY